MSNAATNGGDAISTGREGLQKVHLAKQSLPKKLGGSNAVAFGPPRLSSKSPCLLQARLDTRRDPAGACFGSKRRVAGWSRCRRDWASLLGPKCGGTAGAELQTMASAAGCVGFPLLGLAAGIR